eukprot:TRINITY_DN6335_c0_g1_i4.p1 TRINITY_DN6335_c0_g1~~TRINITY_DN6335_c0_g1_i4.p1  ORF type:complete len:245 (+),score=34.82 TRINITY_DN6335_c0_g1_i4:79-813(+)
MQHGSESSESESSDEIAVPDISSESLSESESEIDMEVSHAFSADSSNVKGATVGAFTMKDASCVDEVEDGLLSYASSDEDDADSSSRAKTQKILQMTARVLREGTCSGELPILGKPFLMIKRDALEDRALAREYIDIAAVSSRALLHIDALQCKLPEACARRVAQFFRPTMSRRDMRRSFYSYVPANARSVCIDLSALQTVLPSKFLPASKRPRRNPWESVSHALWCHTKWKRMFQRWALREED